MESVTGRMTHEMTWVLLGLSGKQICLRGLFDCRENRMVLFSPVVAIYGKHRTETFGISGLQRDGKAEENSRRDLLFWHLFLLPFYGISIFGRSPAAGFYIRTKDFMCNRKDGSFMLDITRRVWRQE